MSSNIQQEILSLEMIETLLHCPLFQVLFLYQLKILNVCKISRILALISYNLTRTLLTPYHLIVPKIRAKLSSEDMGLFSYNANLCDKIHASI